VKLIFVQRIHFVKRSLSEDSGCGHVPGRRCTSLAVPCAFPSFPLTYYKQQWLSGGTGTLGIAHSAVAEVQLIQGKATFYGMRRRVAALAAVRSSPAATVEPSFRSVIQSKIPLSSQSNLHDFFLTLWRRSSSKCYLRIQSVPQREHHTSPLQRSTG
jgi:hypothetical protein